jgi:mono/diheme cytochrome c family protein
MSRPAKLLLLLALAAPGALHATTGGDTAALDKLVRPFFSQHCTKCHGEKKQKGDLRVDTLAIDFESPKIMGHWEEIMNRINSGDMPPEKETPPEPEDIAKVAEWITGQLHEAESLAQSSSGERVAFRKLSREEYANTIHDLLGVEFDVTDPTGLPEDPDWQGFQRIGSVLTLSPAHVEKYYAAAEMVLDEALSPGKEPKREVTKWLPTDLRPWKDFGKALQSRGIGDKVRMDIVPNNGALDDHTIEIKTAGEYIVRVKLSGLRPEGGPSPRLRLYAGDINRLLFEGDIEAPEDQPKTIEFRAHLPVGKHPIHIVNAVPGPNPEARRSRPGPSSVGFTDLQSRIPWQMKFTDDDGKPILPFLLLDSIEWEGPVLDEFPTATHRQIFFKGEGASEDTAYAKEILSRFAERAWRRPVRPEEVENLGALYEKVHGLGRDFETSVRAGLIAALCSKNFIYLIEGKATAPTPKLTDYELASRLSYFLWSTMPDQPLLDLAKAGTLHQPEILRAEVRRMLKDPRAAEFAESFPRQWLELRRVGMFPPDKVLYPSYDEYLEKSMVAETIGYFREVLTHNASLREFLDSDWTMLNERLAVHYDIPGVHGEQMHRVALTPDEHRGGLLTQAAVLSLTSDGTRHRPVHRGVWMLETIFGKPPPPPPANVPALNTPPPGSPKTTLREKLEQHRSDPNCAACHRKIDPLGMAFDNYDAIGRWRTVETIKDGSGADPTLNPSGELPDGRKFADADGLKHLLLDDLDRFGAAFTEKLAIYAFRRGMNFSDRQELKRIAEQAKANDYKIASLIESLVASDLFLKR